MADKLKIRPLVHGIFGYLQIIAMDSFQNSEVCPDGLKAGSLKQRHETARLCPERRLLRPSSVDPCDQLGTPHQLPRVMGISTSRCNSMCFENSSLASDARPHSAAATAALATTSSTSAFDAKSTLPVTSPVAGLKTSPVRSAVPSHSECPMRWVMRRGAMDLIKCIFEFKIC